MAHELLTAIGAGLVIGAAASVYPLAEWRPHERSMWATLTRAR